MSMSLMPSLPSHQLHRLQPAARLSARIRLQLRRAPIFPPPLPWLWLLVYSVMPRPIPLLIPFVFGFLQPCPMIYVQRPQARSYRHTRANCRCIRKLLSVNSLLVNNNSKGLDIPLRIVLMNSFAPSTPGARGDAGVVGSVQLDDLGGSGRSLNR